MTKRSKEIIYSTRYDYFIFIIGLEAFLILLWAYSNVLEHIILFLVSTSFFAAISALTVKKYIIYKNGIVVFYPLLNRKRMIDFRSIIKIQFDGDGFMFPPYLLISYMKGKRKKMSFLFLSYKIFKGMDNALKENNIATSICET
jgi:hypothetical protein